MCPFCRLPDETCVLVNPWVRAFRDSFPVSKGHTLIVPTRHAASIFELSEEEQAAVWSAVRTIRRQLKDELAPAGFNIGINDGTADGQTVPHAHVHVIPRYAGDVPDPRGGIRWVIASRADYWSEQQ
jgi:diadenosine tetraphosphate (Ap4A) HIT family hydrolase